MAIEKNSKRPRSRLQPLTLASLLLALGGWSYAGKNLARIVPDNTLPVNSTVTPCGNILTIVGCVAVLLSLPDEVACPQTLLPPSEVKLFGKICDGSPSILQLRKLQRPIPN